MTTVQWLGRDSNANKAGYTAIQSQRLGRSNNAKTTWNSEMLRTNLPINMACRVACLQLKTAHNSTVLQTNRPSNWPIDKEFCLWEKKMNMEMDISGRREGSALSGIGYLFQNFFISHDNLYCGSIFWERIVLSEGSRLITIKSSRLQALVLLLGSFAGNVVQIS